MQTRKPRIIKQNNPLNEGQDYIRRHEQSLIRLLVPEHIEYARRVLDDAERQSEGRVTQEVAQSAEF